MKKLIAISIVLLLTLTLVCCNKISVLQDENTKGTDYMQNTDEHADTTQPDGTFIDDSCEVSVAWANWYDGSELYSGALNADKMSESSVQHLPIRKFESVSELDKFKMDFSEKLSMDYGYDEVPSFAEVTETMNDDFFTENTVFVVYVSATSGSFRYGVNSIYKEGDTLCIKVEQTNNPESHTDDMAGWFVVVSAPKNLIDGIKNFDAYLK